MVVSDGHYHCAIRRLKSTLSGPVTGQSLARDLPCGQTVHNFWSFWSDWVILKLNIFLTMRMVHIHQSRSPERKERSLALAVAGSLNEAEIAEIREPLTWHWSCARRLRIQLGNARWIESNSRAGRRSSTRTQCCQFPLRSTRPVDRTPWSSRREPLAPECGQYGHWLHCQAQFHPSSLIHLLLLYLSFTPHLLADQKPFSQNDH